MNSNIGLVFALGLVAILLLTAFYAVVGALTLHTTKPQATALGQCIEEAGKQWCIRSQQ